MKKGGKKIHFLKRDSINIADRTATCSKCGYIDIRVRKNLSGSIGWRCFNSHRNSRDKNKNIKNLPTKTLLFGVCPICKIESKLVLDHDHTTNMFRDFICSSCNKMLGFSFDNMNTLLNAIKYLKSY